MNLTRFAIEKKTLTNVLVFLIFVGGIFSYFQLGQLEDPDFTVKIGAIVTQYPGATPEDAGIHPLPDPGLTEPGLLMTPHRDATRLADGARVANYEET